MTWLLIILLVASVALNAILLVVIWDMTSRHHAHALTLIDVNDELSLLRSDLEKAQEKAAAQKASGRVLISTPSSG